MAILAVGDEPESFSNFNTGNTQTTVKDSGQRGSVSANTTGTIRWQLDFSSVTECWYHGRVSAGNSNSATSPIISFYNTVSAKDVLRFVGVSSTSSASGRITRNSTGTTYVAIGADFGFPMNDSAFTIDIYFKRGTSGVLKVFLAGYLVLNETGDFTTADANWNAVRLFSGSGACSHGACIVADECTVGWQIDHLSPSASGQYSEWTGSAANLADTTGAPVVDTATDINVNTTGQRYLANYDDMIALPAACEIPAVVLAARGLIEAGSGNTVVNFMARQATTDYTLNNTGFGTAAANARQIMALDPAGAAWTEANVNAIQFGVISA